MSIYAVRRNYATALKNKRGFHRLTNKKNHFSRSGPIYHEREKTKPIFRGTRYE